VDIILRRIPWERAGTCTLFPPLVVCFPLPQRRMDYSAPVCKFPCPGCGLNLRVSLAAVRLEVARLEPPPTTPSTSFDESSGTPSTGGSGPQTKPVPPSEPPPERLLRRVPAIAPRPRGPSLPPATAMTPADSPMAADVSTVGDKLLRGSKPMAGKAENGTALPSKGECSALPIGSRVTKTPALSGKSSSLTALTKSEKSSEPADVPVRKRVCR